MVLKFVKSVSVSLKSGFGEVTEGFFKNISKNGHMNGSVKMLSTAL